jgi:hypothetical protein
MKSKKKLAILVGSLIMVAILLATLLPLVVFADVPQRINYQGYLTDSGGNPVNGSVNIVFSIYDLDTGGTPLWSETQTVTVSNGSFSVQLGSVNHSLPSFSVTPRYLGIKVGNDPEMTPRQLLASAPYALNADTVDGLHSTAFVLKSGDIMMGSSSNPVLWVQNYGTGDGVAAFSYGSAAVAGWGKVPSSVGIYGAADDPAALAGDFHGNVKVTGDSSNPALNVQQNTSANYGVGVQATADGTNGIAVWGQSADLNGIGVMGLTSGADAASVFGHATGTNAWAVNGESDGSNGVGVWGQGGNWGGYFSTPGSGIGVYGSASGSNGIGVKGEATGGPGALAGDFLGNVHVTGNLTVDGSVSSSSSGSGPSQMQIATLRWYGVNQGDDHLNINYAKAACFDGANIWVACGNNPYYVKEIRASDGYTVATYNLPAGSDPQAICFDGLAIWTADYGTNQVTRIRPTDNTQVNFSVGASPIAVCFDGKYIWVANYFSATVNCILPSNGAIIGTVSGIQNPDALCFDGTYIWAAYGPALGYVAVINPNNANIVHTYSTGGWVPMGICFDGTNIWVSNGATGNVAKLRASDGHLMGLYQTPAIIFPPVPAGDAQPHGLCFDGSHIWMGESAFSGGSDYGFIVELKASDGSPLGDNYFVGSDAHTICYDGLNVWTATGDISASLVKS